VSNRSAPKPFRRVLRPLVWALGALAAPLPALATPWTLEATLARAREAAPEVRAAVAVLREAEASRAGQGVFLPTNPRLFADYRRLASGPAQDPVNGFNLGVDALVEVSNAAGARLAEAEQRLEVARTELAVERVRAQGRAWAAWVEAQVASLRVAVLEDALTVQERVALASQERVAAGVAGEPDLTAVLVEEAWVRAQLAEGLRQRVAAQMALRQLLDLPAPEPVPLGPPPGEPDLPGDPEGLVQRALQRRPELAAVRARLGLLEKGDERLAREAFPRVGLTLGLDAAPASPLFAYGGLSVELPVAQRNQGPRAVVAAQQEGERERLELTLRRVGREVAVAHQGLAGRRAQLALLTDAAVPAALRTQELVEQGWRAGRFDVFRLTQASRELLRVRQQRLETLLFTWLDFIELERASGGLSP
jgi:cobalt-zinc-cadmium efflux system outer membrane protein